MRSGSKTFAPLLLCIMLLFCGQVVWLPYADASASPARCHEYGHRAPCPMPAGHRCCVTGHTPSVLPTYSSVQSRHNSSFLNVIEVNEPSSPSKFVLAVPMLSPGTSP